MKRFRKFEPFLLVSLVAFVAFNIVFGVESQFNFRTMYENKASHFTFREYMEGTARVNGDNRLIRAFAVAVYPGVRLGQALNNYFLPKPQK